MPCDVLSLVRVPRQRPFSLRSVVPPRTRYLAIHKTRHRDEDIKETWIMTNTGYLTKLVIEHIGVFTLKLRGLREAETLEIARNARPDVRDFLKSGNERGVGDLLHSPIEK